MSGHKLDIEFVSEFISESIENGSTSDESILERAKLELKQIDNKIIEVERLKVRRSKILDVISTFDKQNKQKDNKAISLYNISNVNVSRLICLKVNSSLEKLLELKVNKEDLIFTIKQLIDNKILIKENNRFIKGEMYDTYIKQILAIK